MRRVLFLVVLAGCKKDEKVYYDLFNCAEDYTFIEVGSDEVADHGEDDGTDECGDLGMGTIPLFSSTCERPIGEAIIDPCMGPIGTEHDIVVFVDSTEADKVDRANVRLESPGRGSDEYRLEPDSADPGIYKTTLVSVGTSDETREDFVRIKLFSVDPDGGEEE